MQPSEALAHAAQQASSCGSCDLSLTPAGEGYKERPCVKLEPFMTRWCKDYNKGKGYPAGSFIYDECGYYFNLVNETRSPRDNKSVWVQFTMLAFAMMFAEYLQSKVCVTEEAGSASQVFAEECEEEETDTGGSGELG